MGMLPSVALPQVADQAHDSADHVNRNRDVTISEIYMRA